MHQSSWLLLIPIDCPRRCISKRKSVVTYCRSFTRHQRNFRSHGCSGEEIQEAIFEHQRDMRGELFLRQGLSETEEPNRGDLTQLVHHGRIHPVCATLVVMVSPT